MARFGRRLLCAALLAVLAACATPQPSQVSAPTPSIDSVKPISAPAPVSTPAPAALEVQAPVGPFETGRATWYKRSRHTHTTSSGEALDDTLFTAAHRTLPLGSFVRVVDTATGNSVIVRVNDRGPFTRGFIIDLTKSSADALGLFRNNKMIVSLEPLPAPPGEGHPSVAVSTLPTGKAALAALTPPKPAAKAVSAKPSAGKTASASKAKAAPPGKAPPQKPDPKKPGKAAVAKSTPAKPAAKKAG